MKCIRCLSGTLILAGILVSPPVQVASTDLYKVTVDSHEAARAATRTGADALLRVSDGYLVLADHDVSGYLAESGLTFKLVATNVDRAHLALDISHDRDLPDRFHVVYQEGGLRVVQVDQADLEAGRQIPFAAPILTHNMPIVYREPARLNMAAVRELMDLDSLIARVELDSCQSYDEQLQSFDGRYAGTASNYASRDWIAAKFAEFGYDSVVIDSFSAAIYGTRTDLQNVVAIKPGSLYPQHQVVIGAHRDSWPVTSPGADDDGTGTSGVLEIARILADIECNLTFVFVLFDAEEEGLYGAWDYATKAAAGGDSIVLMVNLDMIAYYVGTDSARVMHSPGNPYAATWQSLADSLSGISLATLLSSNAAWDAEPFYHNGYEALTVHEYDRIPYVHTAHDSSVYLDFDYMARMVQATLATVYIAAGTYLPDPMLVIGTPTGVPEVLFPSQTSTFEVLVEGYAGATVAAGSERLNYSVNAGPVTSIPLISVGPDLYEATVPAMDCDSRVTFYLTAVEAAGDTFYCPGPGRVFRAGAATNMTTAFADNFQTYTGWGVSGSASSGLWQRRVPEGGGWRSDPPEDFDGSGMCYVTDNEVDVDVDDGTMILRSPPVDLSAGDAIVRYAAWFYSSGSSDVFEVYVSNDNGTWILVETVGPGVHRERGWYAHEFWVGDYVTPSSTVRVRFNASDLGADSEVEAAVDAVSFTQFWCEPAPQIATEHLPDWTAGAPYSQQLTATGGYGTVTWTDKGDDLSGTGLTLSSAGQLAGTPTAARAISFTAVVTDEIARDDERLFSFAVNPPIEVITGALPDGRVGVGYSFQLLDSGGTGAHVWTDRDSDLAGSGLTLDSDGLLNGDPADTGFIGFVARVEDAVGALAERPLSVHVGVAFVCGDVDGSGDSANVADLTYLVEYLFQSGPEPPILEAANADGQTGPGGPVDVADLMYLVAYVFLGGPAPVC